MNIFIIDQYLKLSGAAGARTLRLGRAFISRGHEVTLFAGSSGSDLKLERSKIGLIHFEGMKVVLFNVPYHQDMSSIGKLRSYYKFSRMVERQGKQLPKPDLIIAVAPPLSAALPAKKLSEELKVPFILEINELWPDAPVKRGTLRGSLLRKAAKNLEIEAYSKAAYIVAGNQEIADAIKGRSEDSGKIVVSQENLNESKLLEIYEKVLGKKIE